MLATDVNVNLAFPNIVLQSEMCQRFCFYILETWFRRLLMAGRNWNHSRGGRLTLNQFENLRNISGAIVQYGKVDNAATTTNSEVIPLVSVGIDFERWGAFAVQRRMIPQLITPLSSRSVSE